ncbi:hypothetical protein [Streptomyces sp. NPDC001401]|uniref:hypothetical protein n=1 Tax=Streptomyces sp. NPDC001401 TaxID=3364570 RepID=UPI00367480DE
MFDTSRLYLSDFRVALGEIVALAELNDADVVANRDMLRESGAVSASVFDGRAVVHAAELLRAVSEDRPGEVTAMVHATENLEHTPPHELLGTLQSQSGHERTPAFIVTGNGCGNFGFAVLAAAGQCREVGPAAVVASDAARPDRRILADSMTVLGDAAGVCVVTREQPPGPSFELVALRSTAQTPPPGPLPATAALRSVINGVSAATRASLKAAGWTAQEAAGMLIGAYSTGSRRFLAHASGIAHHFVPDLQAGHCFSVDAIRGLAELTDRDALPDGAPVLVLTSNRWAYSVLALRYRIR